MYWLLLEIWHDFHILISAMIRQLERSNWQDDVLAVDLLMFVFSIVIRNELWECFSMDTFSKTLVCFLIICGFGCCNGGFFASAPPFSDLCHLSVLFFVQLKHVFPVPWFLILTFFFIVDVLEITSLYFSVCYLTHFISSSLIYLASI